MKITGIEIGEYRQFKNITFDFTYPKGHPKEGQPLEKVCFIGQSGTGKTTLLNVIWELIYAIEKTSRLLQNPQLNFPDKDNFLPSSISRTKYFINIKDILVEFDRNFEIERLDKDFLYYWFEKRITESQQFNLIDTNKLCLFIKDSIGREADAFLFDQKDQPQTFSDFVKTDTQIEKEKIAHDKRINEAGYKKVVSLGDMQSLSIWQYLLREINQYDEETVQQITKIIQSTPKSKITEELQKWINTNPRVELSKKCLNPILNKFFLEVDIDAVGNVPIALRTKHGVQINSSHLSTGTRQLLATAIPLYKFDTKDTVILVDEPERSLFPDIQRDLIDYYTSLAPKAQFFFATHSPIIASAFEPCERFILFFNENGEVDYHTGVAPEGDDPNDILRQDFAMAELMLQKGLEEYERYRQLAMQIRAETDEEKKNQLIVERLELGNRYNFAGQYAQSK